MILGVMKQVKDNTSSVSLPFSNLIYQPVLLTLVSKYIPRPTTYYVMSRLLLLLAYPLTKAAPFWLTASRLCSLTIFSPKQPSLKPNPFMLFLKFLRTKSKFLIKAYKALCDVQLGCLSLHPHPPLFLPLHIAPVTLTFSATGKGICYLITFAFPLLFVQIPFL